MDLAEQLVEQIADPALTHGERARLRCQLAKALEESGDYEGAREAMGELWSRIGERPKLDGLDQATAAEVLLRVGGLTGCIGSAKQIVGVQEIAKNLISESLTIFETLGEVWRVAEARAYLGHCYWRQGEYDEARINLYEARLRLTDEDAKLKALVLLLSAIVEKVTGRLNDALRIHTEAAPLFEKIDDHTLKGKFHNEFAQVLRGLGAAEHRPDYIDRALVAYAAASFHLEQAGHERFRACVENNLGFLFSTVGRFTEAYKHLKRARKIVVRLKDKGIVAQVDDTRAKVLLAEGRNEEAVAVAHAAVQTLEKGDERSLLAEAMTTHGTALARTGSHEWARMTLQCAALVAEQAGDVESAGQAALTIIEELSAHSAPAEMAAVYERAAGLLAGSQHPAVPARLAACARQVLRMFAPQGDETPAIALRVPADWEGFSFKAEIRRFERLLIERSLKDTGGVVTRASQLLGFKHHYSLITLMNRRHKDLLPARSPVVPRKRSIIRDAADRTPKATDKDTRPVTILHVEDNKLVAGAIKDTLEMEGWKVDTCADGLSAVTRLVGEEQYDLLLFDYDLPGVNGIELLRLARKLLHRRRTPVVMLSASDCESEAWRAGADAFLRKPNDVVAVPETVARLLKP